MDQAWWESTITNRIPCLIHMTEHPKRILVSAGLIRGEPGGLNADRFLVSRRPAGTHLGHFWEFPGGKIEPGETDEECLRREIQEELGLDARIGTLIHVNHASPTFELAVYNAQLEDEDGELQLREHEEFRWVKPEELKAYDMLPADEPVIDILNGSGPID